MPPVTPKHIKRDWKKRDISYTIYNYSTVDIQLDGAEWGLVAMNERTGDAVTIVKFTSLSSAKDAEVTPKALRE